MKRSPLKQDPASVKAWQERSQRAAQVRRAADILSGSGSSARQHNYRQVEPKGPARANPLRVVFKAPRPARLQRCFRCNRQAHSHHHWLPQQHIRAYGRVWWSRQARDRRVPEAEVRQYMRKMLRDERNLSPTCRGCHQGAEFGNQPFRAGDVPESAFEFAAELGPEYVARLERMYP